MLSITLPPELEGALSRSARALGTTPESLALDRLRELFALQTSDPTMQETISSERFTQPSSQEEAEYGAVVTEKFRRQGFNL